MPACTGIAATGLAPSSASSRGKGVGMANAGISQLLREQYQVEAHPGAKIACPFCQHRTFSIKPDDTLGKCFHGSCGRFLTVHGAGTSDTISLSSVLAEVYHDFHQELLRLKDADYRDNAYRYLVEDRKIHPRVVEDAMLGAIPGGYDLDSKFASLIDSIHVPSAPPPKGRGRPRKVQERTPEERRQWLIDQCEKLRACLLKHAGWLGFFYGDSTHRIVAIRFRKPGTRYFTYFKPYPGAGLFGHGLFSPYELNGLRTFNKYLIVTEGEFNQLQLQSLLLREAEGRGKETSYLFACAVGGVANTDWGAVHRLVQVPILIHDHDQSGKDWVEDARQFMAVDVCTTPTKDLDEYIRSFSDRHHEALEMVKAIIRGRVRHHRLYSGTGLEFFQESRFVPKRLGDAIMERHHLKYAADVLWVYRDGVYRGDGERSVKAEAQALLGEQRTEGHIQECLRYVEVATATTMPEPNLDFINVKNGRLEWRTKTLHSHSPNDFEVVQLPIDFDASAGCPSFDQYLDTTLTPEVARLAEELIGDCLIPDTRHEKAALLTGVGENGKSVFIDLVTAVLGQDNVSHVALQDLEENRFRAAELFGKLGNFFADLDSRTMRSSSMFKTLVTGDPITAERKFGQPFTFRNYARLIFSCNKIPDSRDRTYAFYRRWLVIPFERTFTGKEADKGLRAKLYQELPGILNRALEGLQRLHTNQAFTVPKAVQDALDAYKRENNTVASFAAECLAENVLGYITKKRLYQQYRGWCQLQKLHAVRQVEFKAGLQELFPSLDEVRLNRGKGPWQWKGIEYVADTYIDEAEDYAPDHEGRCKAGCNPDARL
jgi:P4 family phage/plasmid primase-like protien